MMRNWHYGVFLLIYWGYNLFEHLARPYGFRGPDGWVITLISFVVFALWVMLGRDRFDS
jgi:hypothetical protein